MPALRHRRIRVGGCKVAGTPRVFIPTGHPEAAQRNLYLGKYVVSKKHRTKWYVPNKGVPGRNADELESEAVSFCPPKDRDRYPLTVGDAGLIAGNTIQEYRFRILAVLSVCSPAVILNGWVKVGISKGKSAFSAMTFSRPPPTDFTISYKWHR